MRGTTPSPVPTPLPAFDSPLVAVYDWQVGEDLVRGDENLAQLFSLHPDQVSRGLPISDFLRVIHPDDVKVIESRIAEAVDKQDSFSATYRVRDHDGWKHVTGLGRCYRTESGSIRFSGVVIAVDEKPPAAPAVELPPRELQCLQWCSQGKTNWEIGRILGISERTVEHHIGSAVRRLGCTSRVQGVALALRLGLIK